MAEILGTGYQRAGKASQVSVGAADLTFASWQADVSGEDLETTNFESYVLADDTTYKEGILGPIECSLDFGGDWDAGANPLDDPPGLYPRDDLADVAFTVNRGDATFWEFPYVRLRGASSGSKVGEKVTFTCSGKSQGPFAYPLGSV